MSAFSRLFLQHAPKATRAGVALGSASAMVYMSGKHEERNKIAYCESPRYNLNKASLEPLTRIVWPVANSYDQQIDVTLASKETIGRMMLEDEIHKLVKQRNLLAKVLEKWNDPLYGEWMEDNDVAVEKVVTELGELWNDFNVISNCRASKAMTGDLFEGDEMSNKDAEMSAQLVGLAYKCKGAICRIGELIGKEELDDTEMRQIQNDLHFLRTATKAIIPWLQSYDDMVEEDLDWMYRECLKLEEVQQEAALKVAKERDEQDKIEWNKGLQLLNENMKRIKDEDRLKKTPLQQPGRACGDQSSSISVRRSQ